MGKKWKNAPVMYTVAQIRFNPVLSMESFVPDIQESVRSMGFPDFRREVLNVIGFSIGQPELSPPPMQTVTRFVFGNIEKTAGFVLENNALSYQCADYSNYENFSECILKFLEIVHKKITINYIERIGIRYLDAVLPAENESLADYLVPEVLGLTYLGDKITHSYSESLSINNDGTGLVSKVFITKDPIGLPPEMAQSAYPLNPHFTNHMGLNSVIDTDGYFEGRKTFDLKMIEQKLNDLHEQIVASFKLTATPHALKVWEFGNV